MKSTRLILLLLVLMILSGCADIAVRLPAPEVSGHGIQAKETVPATSPPETTPAPVRPEPEDWEFVRIRDYIPDIFTELPYATEKNFTGQVIYEFSDPWLRYGTVKKLILVQERLKEYGFSLKIWDGFRPTAAQFKLWQIFPDPVYVANPMNGFSSHSRGNTVDLTLVYPDGKDAVMPTGFDDFSAHADRDYSDCSPEAAANARLLEQIMLDVGFSPYWGEWWHFSDIVSYPVEEVFQPVKPLSYQTAVDLTVYRYAASDSEVLYTVPAGEQVRIVAAVGGFCLVEYRGVCGYVPRGRIQPAS